VRITQPHSERGLALLLVVSLLALVTLLVVSLAVITRVETQLSSTVVTRAQARANALFALEVAVGRLQVLAGPDQRATGSAQLIGANGNPHWAGVWRSDESTATPLAWLVSGTSSDPASNPTAGREGIVLVPEFTTAQGGPGQMTAPLESILTNNQEIIGAFGYAFMDEGVKATLAASRFTNTDSDYPAQRLPLMGGGTAVGFTNIPGYNPATEESQSALGKLMATDQLVLLAPTVSSSQADEYRHDYTAVSLGVLSDPVRGALKTDLSMARDSAVPGISKYLDLATSNRSNALSPTYPMRADSGSSGPLYDGIAPILTQLGMHFDVQIATEVGKVLVVRMKFFTEMINPYTNDLEADTLKLQIYGIPDEVYIESETLSNGSDQGDATINLEEIFAEKEGAGGERYLEFELPIDESRWAAGRVYNWKLPNGGAMADTADRTLDVDSSVRNSFWDIRPGVAMSGPDRREDDTKLKFTTSEDWNIRVVVMNSGSEILGEYQFPEFYATDSAGIPATSSDADFGIGVRMVDRIDTANTEADSTWLLEVLPGDFRRSKFDETFFAPMIDLETASYNYDFARTYYGVEKRQVFNRGLDSSSWPTYQPHFNYDVAFFEFPRTPPVSIGNLQHLAFEGGRIYNVGNSWSEFNEWFDQYLFSARENATPTSEVAGNRYLRRIQSSTIATETADGWWVDGLFNLNSSSVEAWAAVLKGLGSGGIDYSFDYLTHSATGEVTGTAKESFSEPLPLVSRFPQSTGVLWEASPEEFEGIYQAGLRTYRRGLHALTDTQVYGLASQIVNQIAEHTAAARPYRSVEEFLSPDSAFGGANLLEYSIQEYDESVDPAERINWDHHFPDSPMKIDRAAPGYMTSGDLMTALAPMVSTRSDTFTVRVYGETINPVPAGEFGTSEPSARTWLEAVVQRFPDGVDSADFTSSGPGVWGQMIADPNWGRRFRVLSLRWLKENEL